MKTRIILFNLWAFMVLVSSARFVYSEEEEVDCTGIDKKDFPIRVTIKTEYSPGLGSFEFFKAHAKNETGLCCQLDTGLRIDLKTQVKRVRQGENLIYKDYSEDWKSFELSLKPNGSHYLGSLKIGTVFGELPEVASQLECSVIGLPPPEPCLTGSDLNKKFIEVAKWGTPDALEHLLTCGADPNFKDKLGCTALLYVTDLACGYSRPTHGSNPSYPAGNTPVFDTQSMFTIKAFLKLLVEAGANIEIRDPITKRTPLTNLVGYDREEGVRFLLELEPNVNTQDIEGNTPLIVAAYQSSDWIVQELLEANADVNLKNKEGKTAYLIAEKRGRKHLLESLKSAEVQVLFSGLPAGKCTPNTVRLKLGQATSMELLANPTSMFLFTAPDLRIELMAHANQKVKKVISPNKAGTFPFTCGVHGGSDDQQTHGTIIVQ